MNSTMRLAAIYSQQSRLLNKNEPKSAEFDANRLKSVSAAEFNLVLTGELKDIKERLGFLKAELLCALDLLKSENGCVSTKISSMKELMNIYKRKLERVNNLQAKLSADKMENFENVKNSEARHGEDVEEEHGQQLSSFNGTVKDNSTVKDSFEKVVRKPRLSDYNFSAETLAFLKNEADLCNSSTKKKPNLQDYAFYSSSLNEMAQKLNGNTGGNAVVIKHNLHIDEAALAKITPTITATREDGSRLKVTNKRLTHSGSLDGSLIKMTPRFEFDKNFGGKLQNPDFDYGNEDTTTVTLIQRPEVPCLTSNLDNFPVVVRKRPEMPKLLSEDLLNSPILEKEKENKIPVLGSGAFKPILKQNITNATDVANNSTFIAGDKRDVRQSIASDANVTYVISSNPDNSSGHISNITMSEYSLLESFIMAKVSFNDLTEAVNRINAYLDQNGTELLTRADLAEILSGHEHNLHLYTLILTKLCRLKKLIADETYFSCL